MIVCSGMRGDDLYRSVAQESNSIGREISEYDIIVRLSMFTLDMSECRPNSHEHEKSGAL